MDFPFSTGSPDGRLGALSRRGSLGKFETETADDFILSETTVINQATITGLIPGAPPANIGQVEVEVVSRFPLDSVNPPSGNVISRVNSPGDVEIGFATRDSDLGTLDFATSLLNQNFTVANSVIDGINKKPNQTTLGEGARTGQEVEIKINFIKPIILPAGHYFFRPEVLVTGVTFCTCRRRDRPRPSFRGRLASLDSQFATGARLVANRHGHHRGATPPTFNMTFALAGETIPEAGTPGQSNCHGETVAAMADQFGSFAGSLCDPQVRKREEHYRTKSKRFARHSRENGCHTGKSRELGVEAIVGEACRAQFPARFRSVWGRTALISWSRVRHGECKNCGNHQRLWPPSGNMSPKPSSDLRSRVIAGLQT